MSSKLPPKACLYVRVSTHHQLDRDSLPFQRQELINYCKYVLNIEDYELFEDAGYSAKNTDRPKYQEMMARIRQGEFTHLLVWKLDRISRNLKDFTEMWEELRERGVTFVSKMEQFDTSTAMGEAMLKIILVFAELERKLTAERVMSIMLSRAEKGLWNGAPVPIGFDWDEEAEFVKINEKEAKTVRLIYDLYEKTGSSADVLHYLELHNIATKRGGKWTTKTINDVLRSPIYKGTLRYNYRESGRGKKKDPDEWILIDDAVPAIIPTQQWERVQKKLDTNYRGGRSKRERARHVHVFAGLLRCVDCDLNYIANLDRARNDGYRPSTYRCRNNAQSKKAWKKCNGYTSDITLGPFVFKYLANMVRVESIIRRRPTIRIATIEKHLLKGEEFEGIAGIEMEGLSDTYQGILEAAGQLLARENHRETAAAIDQELERLKQTRMKYERALDRLERAYLFEDGGMSEKDYLIKRAELKDKLQEIDENIRSKWAGNGRDTKGVDFIQKASRFLIAKNLLSGKADYNSLARAGDKAILQQFVRSVIDRIDMKEKKVIAIHFKGGITHRFLHR